ncbi:unnamed protein product [Cylindrotheca closterium]|uniref:Uncharacterized protein n=1 Tax=Cylindrotheca closterium TaxID=2856 RepID=A0AAD2FVH1_9STRA|nr:unnamed protein product [Cylindrotheca closterium]
MGKSKNNKKVAIAAKPVNSTALTQGCISFSQKSRAETAEIRLKKESDDLDPPIVNNNSDTTKMEEVEYPLKYNRIVQNIDSSQWNLQTLAYLCTIHHARGQCNNKKEVVFGNELFLAWENEPNFHWPWCEGYSENCVDPPETESWEAAADKLLQICDGDWNLRLSPVYYWKLRSLAKVWAIAVELLGHPWTDPETTTVVTELSERRSAAKGRKRERNQDPSTARKPAPIDPRSPVRGFFPEATPKPVRDFIDSDKEDAVMEDTTGPSVISPTNKPVNGKFAYWSDNDGLESIESARDFLAPSHSDHAPTEVVVGNSPAPAQRANDPSATKKAAIRTKYLSEEMKACEVTQMNLTGLPRSNAQILCATINYEWDGDTSEGGSIEKCFIEEMVLVLSMAMDNAEGDLVILPVSELHVWDKKLWLTSKEKVESSLTRSQALH